MKRSVPGAITGSTGVEWPQRGVLLADPTVDPVQQKSYECCESGGVFAMACGEVSNQSVPSA